MDMLHNLMCCYGPRDRAVIERKSSGWQIFSFKELIEATDNFNYHRKLGEGGFGTVYHGHLSDGSQVAVKKLKIWSIKAEMEFKVEVEILGQLRHKNLLSLRGYCAEDKERLIVYDYMQNSSLHAHLHGRHPRPCLLDWPKRMNIAIGSAEGLEYLHHANPHIIHRDVKSSNVLLDSDFQARVADFGFAKLIPDGATHVTTRVKGTLGYLAPEYAMWGKASESCDLYSFGILLMELVSGKKPTENMVPGARCSLADWAVRLVSEGKYDEIVDPKQHLNDSSRNIPPGTDFHFFNNFPAFRQPITIIKNRSESLLREIGASQSLWKRPSRFPADPDEAYDWLVNIHDDIFERVDASMDEFKRVRQEHHSGKPGSVDDIESGFQLVYGSRRKCRERKLALGAKATAAEGDISGGVKVLSRDKKTSGGRSRVPFHIPSIPRPQDRYNIFVDNSNVPFKHPGLQKTEDGSKYIHPLQGELDKIEFAYNQSELPEPLQPAPWESTPFKFVERVQDLKEVAMKLESASEIAVDLEHNQYRSFQGLTCLMQISTRAEDFVVDTLILHKYIGPCLKHIFANPAIKKVMHGADRDILWLQRDFGIFICNLFDTGQASRVLQLERNSLEFLLQHFCDITADKEYQTADWRLRPLPSEMLKYAREDTHYLLYIHDVMQQRLKSMPSESEEVPLFEVYKRSRDICLQIYEKELLTETSYLHVYGLQDGNLSPEQLSVAAGLYEWRDKIARVEDESTGYILPNKVLLQIAKRIPRTTNDLRAFVNGRHPFVERNLAAVLDVIKQAREMRNKAVEISPNPLEQVSRKGADGLKEISDTCNQPLLVSADIADAVNARNVSYVEGLDAKVGSLCENSSLLEDSVSIKSDNRENISSEQTESLIEKKQAEFIESSSSAADTCVVGTASLKKAGLASTVVGRASNSLLFNKKRESVKGSQAIVNESKGNPVCQSLEEQSQRSLSMEGCSSEGPAVVNLENKMESSKQENTSQLIKPAELSNSEKLVQNGATASVCNSLQPNCVALEEAPEIRDKVSAKSGVTLVQAQKRPTRGLAAMLGPSRLKQKSEMSSKVYDTEQDSIRSKVEQIKASVALPFHSLLGTREMVSIQHPLNSEEVPSNEESQVEVGKLVGAEVACSNAEIENNMQALKISAGIVSEEGRKYRAWWPPLQVKANGKKSSIRQIDDGELPLSLSELRCRSWQQGKQQSSFEFQQNTRSEAPSHFNEYLDGKKRKKNLPATRDSNKFFTPRETDGSFKPFDYAAARRSMSFGISEERARDVKDRSGSKNLFGKKGKGSGYDPMNLGASEAGGDLQPGKRRQVFPASGNRSATFR